MNWRNACTVWFGDNGYMVIMISTAHPFEVWLHGMILKADFTSLAEAKLWAEAHYARGIQETHK